MILECAAKGLILGAISYAVTHWVIAPSWPEAASWWKAHFPSRLSGTAAGALIIGLTCGNTLRYLSKSAAFNRWFIAPSHERWLRQHATTLENFLYDSALKQSLVQVTLSNRKVYVGQVSYGPAEHAEAEGQLELQLYASGYRCEKHLRVMLSNHYYNEKLELLQKLNRLEKIKERLDEKAKSGAQKKSLYHHQNNRVAKIYIVIWERIGGLNVYVPTNQIVSGMPFDKVIFDDLDGNQPCCEQGKEWPTFIKIV